MVTVHLCDYGLPYSRKSHISYPQSIRASQGQAVHTHSTIILILVLCTAEAMAIRQRE